MRFESLHTQHLNCDCVDGWWQCTHMSSRIDVTDYLEFVEYQMWAVLPHPSSCCAVLNQSQFQNMLNSSLGDTLLVSSRLEFQIRKLQKGDIQVVNYRQVTLTIDLKLGYYTICIYCRFDLHFGPDTPTTRNNYSTQYDIIITSQT